MSTETTNKKIKIDNGTTFGRTYTDKAVDELLKNAGGGGTSVIELTDKNGTIASAQLGKINANPQNFAFKYSGKILSFTRASSTTYQYCNNNTTSSDNNVMTTSTLLTIESSTGVYTIAENVHNVVANSIHPANGGDLTNIQVGSKVYSIPSGGGQVFFDLFMYYDEANDKITQEGWNKLSNGLINGTYCGILYDEIPLVLCGFNGSRTLYSFTNTEEKDNVSIKIIVKSDLTYTIENVPVLNIPTLPADASTKNYTLNSVNGALTWNTIGDGLTIENGALKTTGGGEEILELNATDSATLSNILNGTIPDGVQSFSTNYPLKDYIKVKVIMDGAEGYYDVSNKLYIPNAMLQFAIFNNYNTSVGSSLDYVRVQITIYPGDASYECHKFKLSLITA